MSFEQLKELEKYEMLEEFVRDLQDLLEVDYDDDVLTYDFIVDLMEENAELGTYDLLDEYLNNLEDFKSYTINRVDEELNEDFYEI